MKPALTRGLKKAGRALLQVVVSGGATAVVNQIVGGLSPTVAPVVGFGWLVFFTFLQNTAESAGTIPVLLPTPGLVTDKAGGATSKVVGTVDVVTHGADQVVGDVIDTSGQVVGSVLGGITGGGA